MKKEWTTLIDELNKELDKKYPFLQFELKEVENMMDIKLLFLSSTFAPIVFNTIRIHQNKIIYFDKTLHSQWRNSLLNQNLQDKELISALKDIYQKFIDSKIIKKQIGLWILFLWVYKDINYYSPFTFFMNDEFLVYPFDKLTYSSIKKDKKVVHSTYDSVLLPNPRTKNASISPIIVKPFSFIKAHLTNYFQKISVNELLDIAPDTYVIPRMQELISNGANFWKKLDLQWFYDACSTKHKIKAVTWSNYQKDIYKKVVVSPKQDEVLYEIILVNFLALIDYYFREGKVEGFNNLIVYDDLAMINDNEDTNKLQLVDVLDKLEKLDGIEEKLSIWLHTNTSYLNSHLKIKEWIYDWYKVQKQAYTNFEKKQLEIVDYLKSLGIEFMLYQIKWDLTKIPNWDKIKAKLSEDKDLKDLLNNTEIIVSDLPYFAMQQVSDGDELQIEVIDDKIKKADESGVALNSDAYYSKEGYIASSRKFNEDVLSLIAKNYRVLYLNQWWKKMLQKMVQFDNKYYDAIFEIHNVVAINLRILYQKEEILKKDDESYASWFNYLINQSTDENIKQQFNASVKEVLVGNKEDWIHKNQQILLNKEESNDAIRIEIKDEVD